jgi:hypothetical protein
MLGKHAEGMGPHLAVARPKGRVLQMVYCKASCLPYSSCGLADYDNLVIANAASEPA